METPRRATIANYNGQIVISDIVKRRSTVPIFSTNETYSASLVTTWYDGTLMDDSKADGDVYFKLKKLPSGADAAIYGQYVGSYFRVNLPNFGELFLEKDTMAEMRALSEVEVLLLKMEYYKGVNLNGYYTRGDLDSVVQYFYSDTIVEDDGGSVINFGTFTLRHEFIGIVNPIYFGARPDVLDFDSSVPVQKAVDYAIKGAPNVSLDIFMSRGTYLFLNGVDLSSNGWQGKFYGCGVGQYSTVIQTDANLPSGSIHALLYTRYRVEAGVAVDRFGRPFSSNGNFELSNMVFRGGTKASYVGNAPYVTDSVTKYCVDFSSSSYIKVTDCNFNRSKVGIGLAKWHGRIERCNINLNEVGIELCQVNEYNTPEGVPGVQYSLALNNFTVESNNFINNKHHIKSPVGAYKVTLTQNVFDKCSGAALVFKNFDHLSVVDNYFEGNNTDNQGAEADYLDVNGVSKTDTVLASNVFWARSNYNTKLIHLEFANNQCVNNTSHTTNSFIALSGVNSYDIKDITFRGYSTQGVTFFGMGTTLNTTSSFNARGVIDINTLESVPKVNYHPNIVRKGIVGLIVKDKANFQQSYLTTRRKLMDTNLLSFVQGDMSLADTSRPTILTRNTAVFPKENYQVTMSSAKVMRAFYDYTNSMYRPSNFVLDLTLLTDGTETSSINYNIEVWLDGVLWTDELIGRYQPTAMQGRVYTLYGSTFYIGSDYNTLEIKLKSNFQKNVTVTEFCIRDSSIPVSFKDKSFAVENDGARADTSNGANLTGTLKSGTINQVTIANNPTGFPSDFGSVVTFNGANYARTFSLFTDNADTNKGIWVQLYNTAGVGAGWRNLVGNASTTVKGLVNQATAVPDGSTTDALLASLRTAGILAT